MSPLNGLKSKDLGRGIRVETKRVRRAGIGGTMRGDDAWEGFISQGIDKTGSMGEGLEGRIGNLEHLLKENRVIAVGTGERQLAALCHVSNVILVALIKTRDLPETPRGVLYLFRCDVAKVSQTHGIAELGLDVCKWAKDPWVYFALGVD